MSKKRKNERVNTQHTSRLVRFQDFFEKHVSNIGMEHVFFLCLAAIFGFGAIGLLVFAEGDVPQQVRVAVAIVFLIIAVIESEIIFLFGWMSPGNLTFDEAAYVKVICLFLGIFFAAVTFTVLIFTIVAVGGIIFLVWWL